VGKSVVEKCITPKRKPSQKMVKKFQGKDLGELSRGGRIPSGTSSEFPWEVLETPGGKGGVWGEERHRGKKRGQKNVCRGGDARKKLKGGNRVMDQRRETHSTRKMGVEEQKYLEGTR